MDFRRVIASAVRRSILQIIAKRVEANFRSAIHVCGRSPCAHHMKGQEIQGKIIVFHAIQENWCTSQLMKRQGHLPPHWDSLHENLA